MQVTMGFSYLFTTKLSTTDVACPSDHRVSLKEQENIEKYQDLKSELKRLWNSQ